MSPQIQRLRMRLLRVDFSLITADTLFRAPVARQDDQYRTEEEIDLYVQHVSASLSASNTQFERVREKQEDEVCQTLRQYCNEGWPDSTRVPDALKPYWQTKDDLSVVHGLLLKAERIVIPTAISLEMFDRVQEGHQGVTKCRERAKRVLWWPGLLNEELTKKELMILSVVPDSSSRSVTCHPSPRLKCPQICVYQTWYTGSGRLRDLIFRLWHLKIQYYSTYFLLLLSFVTSLETILFNMFSFVIIIC